MPEYQKLFKSCGTNVQIAPDVFIEHPERIEVGDNVRFMKGFYMMDGPAITRIGSDCCFYPNFFIQGTADRFIVEDHVDFFPNQYVSTGGRGSWIEIGHHSHFAPNCILYGWGGLKIGPFCNIAAHCLFATIGHDQIMRGDKPMCMVPPVPGPITLVKDVWLCGNAVVTANTTIAKGCIIGANAVVTRDTEPNGLYVGIPARRLRDRRRDETPG